MRVFLLVSIIMGSFLGAGFASGKEVMTYFTFWGESSTLGIIIATITFFLGLSFFFWLSSRVDSMDKLFSEYFGRFNRVFRGLFSLCIFILVATMFAGASSIADIIHINSLFIVLPTMLVVFLCNYFSLRGLEWFNAVLVPTMIVIMLLVYTGFDCHIGSLFSFGASVSAINYVSINMMMLGMLILEVGHKYTRRERLITSIICSVGIGVLLFICNCGLRGVDLSLDMPMLYLAGLKGNLIYTLACVAIWLALLTSIFSNVFILDNYLSNVVRSRALRLILIILGAYIFSLIGFDIMIAYMYSIIGVLGLVLIVWVIIKESRNNRFLSSKKEGRNNKYPTSYKRY